ncbi:MAG: pseudouridine synthase [Cyanobacterium sp. T60_A2020_053]|nr:pseudouridine synthase [Cyanobacterium sp. T60_A2020_053]
MTKYTYLLFYKPYNVLCQFTDDSALRHGRETLKDYIKIPDIYSVGRLDLDSEGLLLLTDNNRVKHRLCDPSFAHPRTYWVQVENIPNQEALKTLKKGVIIQGKKTKPAKAKLLNPAPLTAPRTPPIRYRKSIPTQWLELTLTEGRNRQVRRMTAQINHPTLRLIRYSITINPQVKLTLNGLKIGEFRYLTDEERRALEHLFRM